MLVFFLEKGFKGNRGYLLKMSVEAVYHKSSKKKKKKENGKERRLFMNCEERVKPQSGHTAPLPATRPAAQLET